jgi:hypothetical protein
VLYVHIYSLFVSFFFYSLRTHAVFLHDINRFFYTVIGLVLLFHIFYRITVEWPPRFPDLTPCNFSLLGIIKDRVYAQKPRDLNHLKILIKEEFTSFNDNIELCQTIYRSVANRCQMCIGTEDKQFEHLL